MRKEIVSVKDDNIQEIRDRYPDGLRFVVGDVHGEGKTLQALMRKIRFDPERDHVFFVGDYNSGGDLESLLDYMGRYYQADYGRSGFHLIRGNHEWESFKYPLKTLPDILVCRGKSMDFYLTHAGMTKDVFQLIRTDMAENADRSVLAYRLDKECFQNKNICSRQIIYSRNGLYSPDSRLWPSTEELTQSNACIIHGHTPYCFFARDNGHSSYGRDRIYWENQHIWFSEDLCSFNIDANIKGRYENGEGDRFLTCLCLDILEEIASLNKGVLTIDSIIYHPSNGVFSVPYAPGDPVNAGRNRNRILRARPQMKTIFIGDDGIPFLRAGRFRWFR